MAASPLLGYNTNVRHLGKLFHIQTEDSGSSHGHIFTHLFADGGRIVASKKTTYSHYIETAGYPGVVKQLMRESHKAMFIALRDGLFDEDEAAGARTMAEMQITLPNEAAAAPRPPASAPPAVPPSPVAAVDVDALERAAAAQLADADARMPSSHAPAALSQAAPSPPGRYAPTRPATVSSAASSPGDVLAPASAPPRQPSAGSESIFGGDLLSEKSLDEVILSYLAEDVEDEA